jgi:hypothetical protein
VKLISPKLQKLLISGHEWIELAIPVLFVLNFDVVPVSY